MPAQRLMLQQLRKRLETRRVFNAGFKKLDIRSNLVSVTYAEAEICL